jgi:hypothetical protein
VLHEPTAEAVRKAQALLRGEDSGAKILSETYGTPRR